LRSVIGGAMTPQICAQINPGTVKCYLIGQKLCRCDLIKCPETRRKSWINWVGPTLNHTCHCRRDAEEDLTKAEDEIAVRLQRQRFQ
jgi:hypothetical protein